MTQILINQVAVGLFLLATLILGLRTKRASTMEEYATAGRSLSSGVLMISLIATLISSRDVWLERAFSKGLITIFVAISTSIMAVLLGWFVYPNLTYFKGKYTMSELIEDMYGKAAGMATVLISVVVSILMIASQLKFGGELANLLSINSKVIIFIFGSLITLYTCLGGIRSVAYTDVLQFCCVAIGSMIILILHLIDRGDTISNISLPIHYNIWNHPNIMAIFLITFFWGICPTLLIMPPVIQRVLFFTKKQSIKNTFYGVSIVYLGFVSLMMFIGISLAFRHEAIERGGLTMAKLIYMITHNTMGHCIFIIVLIAITMSTMDSFLNATTLDVVLFFRKNNYLQNATFKQKNQLITLIIGVLATVLAMINVKWSGEYVGYSFILLSTLLVPFLAGVIGLKGSKKVFWVTMATFLAVFIFIFFVADKNWTFRLFGAGNRFSRKSNIFNLFRIVWFISILSSSAIFFISHYLYFGGFVWENRAKNKLATYSFASIDWTWLTSPVAWANKKAEKYGTEPYWLGVFIYVSYLVPYISTDKSLTTGLFVVGLRSIGIVMTTLLLIESIWLKKYLKYFNLFYFITVFFCVPFVAIMTTWQDSRSGLAVGTIVSAIVLLILLVDWQTFILFNMIALLFSMIFQKIWHGYLIPDFGTNGAFLLSANTIYCLAVCLIFARKKQLKHYLSKYNLSESNKKKTKALAVQKEAHRQLADSLDPRSSMISEMTKVIGRLDKGILDPADISKLKSAIAHLTMVKDKSLEYLPLKPTKTTLKALIQNVGAELKATGWAVQVDLQLHLQQVEEEDEIRADITYLKQLIFTTIKYQCKYYQATQVHCTIAPAIMSYSDAEITNQKKAYQLIISTNRQEAFKKLYHMSQGSPKIADNRSYLPTNLHITTSHMGVMEIQETKDTCVLTYVLLCDVKEINPMITVFSDEDLQRVTQLSDDEDVAFLKLASSKGLSTDLMERALRTSKHYHRHQERNSGELFYLHPLAVTTMLLEHTTDEDTIIAGLLHDILEDTAYTAPQMTAEFGLEVTQIVKDITNLYDQESRKVKLAKKEVFAGLLEKENTKALLVKLLDRKHNLRAIEGHKTIKKRKSIATETLKFFVPLAQKLGKNKIEAEFVTKCEKILNS